MKKQKIVLGLGALALAVGAFFAGNAHARFATTTLFYTLGTATCHTLASVSTIFQTVASGAGITFVTTAGGNLPQAKIYKSRTLGVCSNAVAASAKIRLQ